MFTCAVPDVTVSDITVPGSALPSGAGAPP